MAKFRFEFDGSLEEFEELVESLPKLYDTVRKNTDSPVKFAWEGTIQSLVDDGITLFARMGDLSQELEKVDAKC